MAETKKKTTGIKSAPVRKVAPQVKKVPELVVPVDETPRGMVQAKPTKTTVEPVVPTVVESTPVEVPATPVVEADPKHVFSDDTGNAIKADLDKRVIDALVFDGAPVEEAPISDEQVAPDSTPVEDAPDAETYIGSLESVEEAIDEVIEEEATDEGSEEETPVGFEPPDADWPEATRSEWKKHRVYDENRPMHNVCVVGDVADIPYKVVKKELDTVLWNLPPWEWKHTFMVLEQGITSNHVRKYAENRGKLCNRYPVVWQEGKYARINASQRLIRMMGKNGTLVVFKHLESGVTTHLIGLAKFHGYDVKVIDY